MKRTQVMAVCHGRLVYHLVVLAEPGLPKGDIKSFDRTLCAMSLVTRGGKAQHELYLTGTPIPKIVRKAPSDRRLCKTCRRVRRRARAKQGTTLRSK